MTNVKKIKIYKTSSEPPTENTFFAISIALE